MMSRASVVVAVVCLAGCTTSHRLDAPPAPPDCGGELRRDVDILWVLQNRGTSFDARAAAGQSVAGLLEAIRARADVTVRMGVLDGHVSPIGIEAAGSCPIYAGSDGVLRDHGPRGEPLERVVAFEVGQAPEPGLVTMQGLFWRIPGDECGNELLEAALRAITPSTVPLSLPAGAAVHGDRENSGLTRPGDVLVLLFVTFMDDCSWNETVVPGVPFPCERSTDYCCESVIYPTQRYLDGYRAAADALGVELVIASMTAVTEPDVPAAVWRTRPGAEVFCPTATSSVFVNMPYRILEISEAFSPSSTSQSACDGPDGRRLADLDTIVDRIVQAACE